MLFDIILYFPLIWESVDETLLFNGQKKIKSENFFKFILIFEKFDA